MKPLRFLLAATTLSVLVACGGGGGSAGTGAAAVSGVISGTATKGPMSNAAVRAYGISGGQVGAQIGTATTDVAGTFTIGIGGYAGPVMLEVSGGSYTDEATSTLMAMLPGDVMTVVIPTIAAGSITGAAQVTPLTAMAQTLAQHMAGGMTDANIAAANTAVGNYFSVDDIMHVKPMNPLVPGSGAGASQDAQNYGMTLAAMSKYAQMLGMSSSSAMVTALMNDAADGMMDGRAGGIAVPMHGMAGSMMMPAAAGASGLATAMNGFMTSTQNKSGLTTPLLMGRLNAASGQIVSAGPAATNSTVSGTAFFGPMSKATMTVYAVDNGVMGAQIASMATDEQGHFTLPLGSYSGPVMLQMSGGIYTDEATGTDVTMRPGDVMSAAIPTVSTGASVTGIWVTPITSMAQARASGMSGGMSDANIAAANAAVGRYFSVSDILHTQPMNPMLAGAGVSQDALDYGMTLAAMSQYAKSLGMAISSTMVTAMTADATDGVMDGRKGGSPISMPMGGMMGGNMMAPNSGTSGMATAMTSFINSPANASSVTAADMSALMQQLISCNGQI